MYVRSRRTPPEPDDVTTGSRVAVCADSGPSARRPVSGGPKVPASPQSFPIHD